MLSRASSGGFRLTDVCPRLALARDQFIAHRAEQWRIEGLRQSKLLELRRLVDHRDLQLIRAYHTGNTRYIAERQRKLKQAQHRLRAVERKS